MPKYIECEALKEDIKNHFKKLIDEGYVYDEIFESNAEILRIIDAQPTADVVEVVRCKDCRYQDAITCPITGAKAMFCEFGFKPKAVNPDHFCSLGEKR